jgi:ATP-dependent DNA ligase
MPRIEREGRNILLRLNRFTPYAAQAAARAFRHPDWLFELKYDSFRTLAHDSRRPRPQVRGMFETLPGGSRGTT